MQILRSPFGVFALFAALSLTSLACGSPDGPRRDGGGGDQDGGGNDTDGGGNNTDGGGNNTDGGGNNTDGGNNNPDGGIPNCRTACSQNDCGEVPNCAGGVLQCATMCDTGLTCNPATSRCECEPLTAAEACPGHCGAVTNGCGGVVQCDGSNGGVTCEEDETCSGANSTCAPVGPGPCTPITSCGGNTCGMIPDSCGMSLNCWPQGMSACPAGQGCVNPTPGDPSSGPLACRQGTIACNGSLCDDLPTCDTNSPTALTGTVRTPGRPASIGFINRVPVPNAIVYIPADPGTPLPGIFEGAEADNPLACGRCSDERFVADGQSVLASGITDHAGNFTLEGRIPVGVAFKMVIKVGKWRRVVDVPAGQTTACTSRALDLQYTLLNARHNPAQGDHLPHIAVSTGEVDAMECVLRNIGVADDQFSIATGSGRVHLYRGEGDRGGARMPTCTGNSTTGNTTCTGRYYDVEDEEVHNCSSDSNYGCNNNMPGCVRRNQVTACNATINHVPNAGCASGASGCSWSGTNSVSATELYGNGDNDNNVGLANDYDMVIFDCEGEYVDFSGRRDARIREYVTNGGRMFASHFAYTWIENNGTLDDSAQWGNGGSEDTGTGRLSLPVGTGVNERAGANPVKSLVFRDWLDGLGAITWTNGSPRFPIYQPRDRAGLTVGASTDEWVYRNAGDPTTSRVQQLSFNTPYGADEATACGRVAYTGFHVAQDDDNNELNLNDDNDYFPYICPIGPLRPQELSLVFMLFDLNACVSDGDPPTPPVCTPLTAAELCPGVNDACGYLSDGCGSLVDCGGCASGNYCNGTVCTPATCTPMSCAAQGYACGQFPDGCGGIADGVMTDTCGTCPSGQTCGPNGQCSGDVCIPNADPCDSRVCGNASNGCGQTVQCGMCAPNEFCTVNGNCVGFD